MRSQPLLPSFRTPGQSTFFRFRQFSTTVGAPAGTIADGERTRIAPQLYYYVGSFGLIGEYTEVSQDVSRVVAIGCPRTHGGHECLAARALVLPDGRGGLVPRLPAEVEILAGRQYLGRL